MAKQRVIWEVVDNDGEGVFISYSFDQAKHEFMQMEDGTRLVKHRGERIVAEFERYSGNMQGFIQLD